MSGKIKADSPLGNLLTSKGVKFAHTSARPGARAGVSAAVRAPLRAGAGAPRNMSSYTRTDADYNHVLKEFAEHKACAVLRTPIVGACTPAMQAAVDGGFKLIEFTLTTPGCLDSVAEFAAKKDSGVMMGVGTVMNVQAGGASVTFHTHTRVFVKFYSRLIKTCN